MESWLTSDTHHQHANIIRFCDRPFADADEMDDALVQIWNATVQPGERVLHLGDVALGKGLTGLQVIARLNGTKVLVPGNHDRCWEGNRRGAVEARGVYLDAGFEEIDDHPEPIEIAGQLVQLSHFPYRNEDYPLEKYVEHRPVDRGGWLVHGHVHEKWRQRGRQINVGVDAWGGRPVHIDEIAALIEAGPRDLPPLPW